MATNKLFFLKIKNKNMSKVKVLGTQYGIEITKPWSNKMYEHNDKIADVMKERISESLQIAYTLDMEDKLRKLCKYICSYSMGSTYTMKEIYEEACNELEHVQNFWLNDIYPDMVKDGLVKDVEEGFVGYNKNI